MAERVLIVEDHEDTRFLYRTFLEAHGYLVTEAATGEEGVAKALADPPAAVVLDFALPKMDGFEVARRLRADARTSSVPIVMVSAQNLPRYAEVARQAGANEALEKPCLPPDLVAAIRRVVAKT